MTSAVLEGFARHTRTFTDEYGTFYVWLEGSHGGETVLVWLEHQHLESILRGLRGLCFRGRMVLAVHGLPGLATPFARALHWSNPRKALIISEGEGVGTRYGGGKEVAEEVWVSWDDPRPGRLAQYVAPSGLEFAELRAYVPWQHPLPIDTLAEMEGPIIGGQVSVLSYGLGLVGAEINLRLLLQAWRLLEE